MTSAQNEDCACRSIGEGFRAASVPRGPWPPPPQPPLHICRYRPTPKVQGSLGSILARAEPAILVLAALPASSAFALAASGARMPFEFRGSAVVVSSLQEWCGASAWSALCTRHRAWLELQTLRARLPLHSAGVRGVLKSVEGWGGTGGEPKLLTSALETLAVATRHRVATQLEVLECGGLRILVNVLSAKVDDVRVCASVARVLAGLMTGPLPESPTGPLAVQAALRDVSRSGIPEGAAAAAHPLLRALRQHRASEAVQRDGLASLRGLAAYHPSGQSSAMQAAVAALQQPELSSDAALEALYLFSWLARRPEGRTEIAATDKARRAIFAASRHGSTAVVRGVACGLMHELPDLESAQVMRRLIA